LTCVKTDIGQDRPTSRWTFCEILLTVTTVTLLTRPVQVDLTNNTHHWTISISRTHNSLNKFFLWDIAYTADISNMYREILFHPAGRDFHRYLVRNSNGEIEDWRMKHLTFGVSSSPKNFCTFSDCSSFTPV